MVSMRETVASQMSSIQFERMIEDELKAQELSIANTDQRRRTVKSEHKLASD